MGEVKKMEVKETVEKKSIGYIAEVNELMTVLVIVHKAINPDITNQLIDLKINAMEHVKKLSKFRESLSTITAETEELKIKAINEKWMKEIAREVEFPVQKLTKEDLNAILQANKDSGLNGGQVAFLYEIFKINTPKV